MAPFKMKEWNHVEIEMAESAFSVSINRSTAQTFGIPLLRKVCFGGLYERPDWPMGMSRGSDIRLDLASIRVE